MNRKLLPLCRVYYNSNCNCNCIHGGTMVGCTSKGGSGQELCVRVWLWCFWRGKNSIIPIIESQFIGPLLFSLPSTQARQTFSVSFYLVSIMYLLFDIEICYLFPYVMCHANAQVQFYTYIFTFLSALLVIPNYFFPLPQMFWTMNLFLSLLVVGFVYEWGVGALEWRSWAEMRTQRRRGLRGFWQSYR